MKHILKVVIVGLFAFAAQSSFVVAQSQIEFDASACKSIEETVANLPTKAENFEALSELYHMVIGMLHMREAVSQEEWAEVWPNMKKLAVCIDQIAEKNDIRGHRYPGAPNPYKADSSTSAFNELADRLVSKPAPRCD